MRNCDFRLNLCLIREQQTGGSLVKEARLQVMELFLGKGTCYVEGRTEDGLEIVVAEVQGSNQFELEEDVVDFVEQFATDELLSWIQGYQVKIELKTERCACELQA